MTAAAADASQNGSANASTTSRSARSRRRQSARLPRRECWRKRWSPRASGRRAGHGDDARRAASSKASPRTRTTSSPVSTAVTAWPRRTSRPSDNEATAEESGPAGASPPFLLDLTSLQYSSLSQWCGRPSCARAVVQLCSRLKNCVTASAPASSGRSASSSERRASRPPRARAAPNARPPRARSYLAPAVALYQTNAACSHDVPRSLRLARSQNFRAGCDGVVVHPCAAQLHARRRHADAVHSATQTVARFQHYCIESASFEALAQARPANPAPITTTSSAAALDLGSHRFQAPLFQSIAGCRSAATRLRRASACDCTDKKQRWSSAEKHSAKLSAIRRDVRCTIHPPIQTRSVWSATQPYVWLACGVSRFHGRLACEGARRPVDSEH